MTHRVSLLTSQSVACSLMISHFSTLSLYLMKKPASLAESIEVGTNGKGSLVIVWQPLAVREKNLHICKCVGEWLQEETGSNQ